MGERRGGGEKQNEAGSKITKLPERFFTFRCLRAREYRAHTIGSLFWLNETNLSLAALQPQQSTIPHPANASFDNLVGFCVESKECDLGGFQTNEIRVIVSEMYFASSAATRMAHFYRGFLRSFRCVFVHRYAALWTMMAVLWRWVAASANHSRKLSDPVSVYTTNTKQRAIRCREQAPPPHKHRHTKAGNTNVPLKTKTKSNVKINHHYEIASQSVWRNIMRTGVRSTMAHSN